MDHGSHFLVGISNHNPRAQNEKNRFQQLTSQTLSRKCSLWIQGVNLVSNQGKNDLWPTHKHMCKLMLLHTCVHTGTIIHMHSTYIHRTHKHFNFWKFFFPRTRDAPYEAISSSYQCILDLTWWTVVDLQSTETARTRESLVTLWSLHSLTWDVKG